MFYNGWIDLLWIYSTHQTVPDAWLLGQPKPKRNNLFTVIFCIRGSSQFSTARRHRFDLVYVTPPRAVEGWENQIQRFIEHLAEKGVIEMEGKFRDGCIKLTTFYCECLRVETWKFNTIRKDPETDISLVQLMNDEKLALQTTSKTTFKTLYLFKRRSYRRFKFSTNLVHSKLQLPG